MREVDTFGFPPPVEGAIPVCSGSYWTNSFSRPTPSCVRSVMYVAKNSFGDLKIYQQYGPGPKEWWMGAFNANGPGSVHEHHWHGFTEAVVVWNRMRAEGRHS